MRPLSGRLDATSSDQHIVTTHHLLLELLSQTVCTPRNVFGPSSDLPFVVSQSICVVVCSQRNRILAFLSSMKHEGGHRQAVVAFVFEPTRVESYMSSIWFTIFVRHKVISESAENAWLISSLRVIKKSDQMSVLENEVGIFPRRLVRILQIIGAVESTDLCDQILLADNGLLDGIVDVNEYHLVDASSKKVNAAHEASVIAKRLSGIVEIGQLEWRERDLKE